MTAPERRTVHRADYVVVGAGSAGCVLAARLSADPANTVVLVEAGPADGQAEVGIPAAFPTMFGGRLDWDYGTVAQAGLDGRELRWPRGRVLGGSSSLNAQIWTRGHEADYRAWAELAGPGWGPADVLALFRRAEDHSDGGAGYGTGGAIRLEGLRDPSPLTQRFLDACTEVGLTQLDGGGLRPDGAGPVRTTQRNGKRWSAADAYLRPALDRENLTVLTGAQVRRIVVEDGRAVGVECRRDGATVVVQAGREVLLSAGAIGSPQLLMLSGIGPADHLRELGIDVLVDSPRVGTNLLDHLYVPLAFAALDTVSPGATDTRAELTRYVRERRGPLTSNIAEALAFLPSDRPDAAPDIELIWMLAPFLGQSTEAGNGITLGPVLLQPSSSGRVLLRTPDAADAPLVDAGYLGDPGGDDLARLADGVRFTQRVLTRPVLASRLGVALTPGATSCSAAGVRDLVRTSAQTLYHPVGTCAMGTAPSAVVDPLLRVRGVTGLRVVDASIMPTIPRAHTHAPTVMLAERAADLVTDRTDTHPADRLEVAPA